MGTCPGSVQFFMHYSQLGSPLCISVHSITASLFCTHSNFIYLVLNSVYTDMSMDQTLKTYTTFCVCQLQSCRSEVKTSLSRNLYIVGIVAIVVGVVQVCGYSI